MPTVYLVRHGRTAWNAAGKFQGTADIPLDDEGREQVRKTGVRLSGVRIDRAVTSDLMRAQETAEIVLAGHLTQLRVDPRWRERDFGAWEGLTWAEITERVPELAGRKSVDVRTYPPENGEHLDSTKARTGEAFDALLDTLREDETGLVVSHAGAIHAVLDVLFGGEREAHSIPPAGLIRIDVADGVPVMTGDPIG